MTTEPSKGTKRKPATNCITADNVAVNGDRYTVEGDKCCVRGNCCKVTGYACSITGDYNEVSGDCCEIIGNYNKVPGQACVITGYGNRVSGGLCTVTGNGNIVSGISCKVIGDHNSVSGHYCDVTGRDNTCTGIHRDTVTISVPVIDSDNTVTGTTGLRGVIGSDNTVTGTTGLRGVIGSGNAVTGTTFGAASSRTSKRPATSSDISHGFTGSNNTFKGSVTFRSTPKRTPKRTRKRTLVDTLVNMLVPNREQALEIMANTLRRSLAPDSDDEKKKSKQTKIPDNLPDPEPRFKEDTPEKIRCGVCCEREKHTLFIPCGHVAMCQACAILHIASFKGAQATCIICRAKIDTFVRVYES